ncbi:MAG: hypothetical protein CMP20_01735 [Rickettsiales bacterium]|nr:hypothetical protein [Rickettsiales bacterium]
MSLTLDLAFTPVDPGEYVVYAYVDGVVSGTPRQPIRFETSNGTSQRLQLEVPSGATLFGVAVYQKDRTDDGRTGYVHAGWAWSPIADLPLGVNLPVVIRHNTDELANLRKGTLTVKSIVTPSVSRPRVLPNTLTDQLIRRMTVVVPQIYQPAERYSAAFAASKRLKAPFWYTAIGPQPLPVFFSRRNVVPPSQNYLLNLVRIGAERHGLDLRGFGALLQQVLSGQGDIKRVGRVYASVLTAYSNALPYLTDYALSGKRRLSAEWFDRGYLRQSNDCEDFARLIYILHRWITGLNTANAVLNALAQFASGYLCVVMLGMVTQPKVGNGINEHENERDYSGHMWALLVSREQFGAWKGQRVQGTAWTLAYPYPFVLEGTGYVDPIVKQTPQERMLQDGIRRAVRAFPDIGSLLHNIPSTSAYHASSFYRQAMMCYTAEGQEDWVDEFAWVDASGRHGVTFDDLVNNPQSVRLQKMNDYPQDVKTLAYQGLDTMVPERAPLLGPTPRVQSNVLLGAYAGVSVPQTGIPVNFYAPTDAQRGISIDRVASFMSQALARRNQIVSYATYAVEQLDINVTQLRLTLVVNA